MKKFLLGTVGLIALGVATVPASAADLAARPVYTKAPAMIPAYYDWSGFYIGGNGGYGSSRNCYTLTSFPGGAEGCHDATGAVAGGQLGYRWQSSAYVFGLEAQGDWADLRGSNVSAVAPAFTNRTRIDAFGLFTGQVGYAWNNTLLYVKGGAAVTDNRYDVVATGTNVFVGNAGGDQTRWGGTVGVGLEYGFTPNWSLGVEYDHLFMQDKTVSSFTPAGVLVGTDSIRQDVDMVTLRVNYRWGGPTISRY